jgi:ADP-heptose:LPS heptosyltransferase
MHPFKRTGTALSWPLAHFAAVARELLAMGWWVVVVGDGADRPTLERAFANVPGAAVETGRSLPELVALIARAGLFLGNSSGPLHLAGLTGTPHVGFYPQNRVSAPARWRTLPGPELPAESRARLLAPSFPVACVRCAGERCPYFNCVGSIGPERVLEIIATWGLAPVGAAGSAG